MDFYKDTNGYFVIGAGKYPTGLYYTRFRESGNIDILPVNYTESLPSYSNIPITSLRKADGSYYTDELDVIPVIGDLTMGIPTPLTVDGRSVNKSNPLPTSIIDNSGKSAANSVFSDQIVGKRIPQITAQFQYPLTQDGSVVTTANGATASQSNSMLYLNTDAQSGSSIEIHSTDTLRYIPGFEVYNFFTVGFNMPVDGQDQYVGLLDDDTGFGIGYHGLDFVFIHRRGSINNYYSIDLNAFNNTAGYELDPTKGNVYKLTFGYLGFAPATLEVMGPDNVTRVLYIFPYPNNNIETHLSQTFLPVRAELKNNTGTIAMELFIGSLSAGIVDGSGCSEYEFARFFNYTAPAITITDPTALVAFKPKDTFGGRVNYVESRLALISGATDLNKVARFVIIKNPVITNTPTWNNVDVDSTVQYSEDITIDFANSNDYFIVWNTGKVDSFLEQLESLHLDLKPGDVACFYLASDGTGEVNLAINWWELF